MREIKHGLPPQAGATATGTHGTGRLLGSLSKAIVGMRMILANGTIVSASKTQNSEIFLAGRVGLGSLGIIFELTIETVPLFRLELVRE